MNAIYLDNNATTPLSPAVWDSMRPYALDHYGNAASAHSQGRRARRALEDSRELLSELLCADPSEVVFTSGGTEANNLAVSSLAGSPPGHLLTTPLEHPSVIEPLRRLGDHGFDIRWLQVDHSGVAIVEGLSEQVRPETRLVCTMLANHETGAIQPVEAVVQAVAGRAPLHCDAVQAVGKIDVHFRQLGAATLSLSAHKFHGPKGVGALLVRNDIKLSPQLLGGPQQRGRRPGTEPVALVVGMVTALELVCREREARNAHVLRLRWRFLELLRPLAGPVVVNGPESGGVPHTVNVSFPGCRGDVLLMNLDLAGVACSTGSACSSGSLLPSPVLRAMGVPEDVLHSAMRFSFSALQTEAEIDEAARRVARVVERLRRIGEE